MDPGDDLDSSENVDVDVQSEVESILSQWSKKINVEASEDVVKEINDDDMRETVKNLVQDLSPRKSDVPPLQRPRFSGGRIWKSAIPPKNPIQTKTPSPQKVKRTRRTKRKRNSTSSSSTNFSRTLPPKKRNFRPLVGRTTGRKKKKEKKVNFLLTSTSFHKKDNSPQPAVSKVRKKKRRTRRKKVSRKIVRPPKLIPPVTSTRSNVPPRIQHLQNEYENLSRQRISQQKTQQDLTTKKNRRHFDPPPIVDSSLHETLQQRVKYLKSQLEQTIQPTPINTLPISPHGSPVVSRPPRIVPPSRNEQLPSIIGDGDVQYEAQRVKQEELEKELSRLRSELLKQKQEKISVSNELKALEIEKQKKLLHDEIKEREAREKKAIEEVIEYRNTRILIRYFSRWRRRYNQKNPENQSKKKSVNELRVKISVIFEWKLKRRIFRKFRRFVQFRRDQREKKRIRERLRQDQSKIEAIKRERRIKIITKTFQKWRFKARMKAAERGFQKEREILAKQRSKFISQFRSKLTGEEEEQQQQEKKKNKKSSSRLSNKSGVIITNLQNSEVEEGMSGSKEPEEEEEEIEGGEEVVIDEEIPHLGRKRIRRIRRLKTPQQHQRQSTTGFEVLTVGEEEEEDDDDDERGETISGNFSLSPKRTTTRRRKRKTGGGLKSSGGVNNKFKRPLFVKTMEDRQRKRKENWKKLKEKYKEQDEERARLELEEQHRKEEEEIQKKRETREKKRQVEQKRKARILERKRKKEMYRQKLEKANEKRGKLLMKYYGWNPWMKFLRMRRELSDDVRKIYHLNLKKRTFIAWLGWTKNMKHSRELEDQRKIDAFEGVVELRMKKYALKRWREKWKKSREELKRYDIQYHKSVRRKYLNYWVLKLVNKRKKREQFLQEIEGQVSSMSRKVTLKYYFGKLIKMMERVREEKEKEELGKELRSKVDSWITEFRLKRNFNWDEI